MNRVFVVACGLALLATAPIAESLGVMSADAVERAHGGAIVDLVRRVRVDDATPSLVVVAASRLPDDARVALSSPDGDGTEWSTFVDGVARLDTRVAHRWRGHERVADLHLSLRAPNGPDSARFTLDVLDGEGAGVRLGFGLALTPVTVDAQVSDDGAGALVRVDFSRTPDHVEGTNGSLWYRVGDAWLTRLGGVPGTNDTIGLVASYADGARVVTAVIVPKNDSTQGVARTPASREPSTVEGFLAAATFIGIGAVAAVVGARRVPRFRS